ncbi:MAG: hypothetical protein A3G35_16160 [candidate division NC10 bacterium RIFCSPLOWO2_12_FULL_66_18]|nr:MAG: hypothetical protein A3G35_16160 [candidate division NC10 bacterium RIFCSPLOWO2_12_FULL_66_18]
MTHASVQAPAFGSFGLSGPGRIWARIRRRGFPLLAGLILVGIAGTAVFAPLVTTSHPGRPRLQSRLQPPSWLKAGSTTAIMGTDNLGRDVWSRIAFGARVSAVVAVVSVALAGTLGVSAGVLAGYFRGWVDEVIMFLTDIQLSCPFLLLAIALAAVLGPSLQNAVIALGVAAWPTYCRIVRGEVLSLREKEFVEGSVALGASHLRIIWKDVLPNVAGQVTVVATLMVSRMIVTEASLSFLGLGVQPPTPSWGLMISESRDYISVAWWLATFPGLVLTLTVLAMNQAGDWLRDRLDPRLGRGRLE